MLDRLSLDRVQGLKEVGHKVFFRRCRIPIEGIANEENGDLESRCTGSPLYSCEAIIPFRFCQSTGLGVQYNRFTSGAQQENLCLPGKECMSIDLVRRQNVIPTQSCLAVLS